MPDAPSRADALVLAGLAADVPDWALADAVAETTGLDAATLRRGWALDRARGLLVRLAAHDGRERCEECFGPLVEDLTVSLASGFRWCVRCIDRHRPGPTPAELLALLREALAEALDSRAFDVQDVLEIITAHPHEATARIRGLVNSFTRPACPGCERAAHLGVWPRQALCGSCGWAGPAAALLPPLLSRAELDVAALALRRGRG